MTPGADWLLTESSFEKKKLEQSFSKAKSNTVRVAL